MARPTIADLALSAKLVPVPKRARGYVIDQLHDVYRLDTNGIVNVILDFYALMDPQHFDEYVRLAKMEYAYHWWDDAYRWEPTDTVRELIDAAHLLRNHDQP